MKKLPPSSEQLIQWEVKDWKGRRVWWRYTGSVSFLTIVCDYLRSEP